MAQAGVKSASQNVAKNGSKMARGAAAIGTAGSMALG